jgi:dimeric dUTPase (all-alpha-NTP-PPase superfamily)
MLDIQKLLDMQKELDKTILDNAGIKEYPLENIKLALLVELGELANEWKGFKHWKKHKEINREKLLEEFADCLSFALSLENELHETDNTEVIEVFNCAASQTYTNNELIIGLVEEFNKISSGKDILINVIAIGAVFRISSEEMERAYLAKNKVNYERQNNGY